MRAAFAAFALALLCALTALPAAIAQASSQPAQPPPGSPAPASGTNEPPPAPSPAPDQPHGKVLFSRSTDSVRDAPPVAAPETSKPITAPAPASGDNSVPDKAADAERTAISFTAYDLDIRLFAHQQSLAVRARCTLRNDGDTPLKQIRLQLSSTLKWERLSLDGKPAAFKVQALRSDADHTGSVNEAMIDLPAPLDPKAILGVDAMYSGEILASAARLEQIGTPTDIAHRSDWDELSDDAIALRGFGNVVWYPVSAPLVALGDGAKYFTEVGRQKQRQTGATFQAQLTAEFIGQAPNVAIVNGLVEPVTVTAPSTESYPGVVASTLPKTSLGFQTPSLFFLNRTEIDASDLQIYTSDTGRANAQNYLAAAALVDPMIHQWLGGRPKTPLAVIDLPEAGDAPFEAEAALFIDLGPQQGNAPADQSLAGADAARTGDTRRIALSLSHALSHAYFHSPRPWLDEGVAHFMSNLWLEQARGADAALEANESARQALALAEPEAPGEAHGQTLVSASDPVYYRTKAAMVLRMLREVAGDLALADALRRYSAAEDTRPEYFETLLEKSSGKDLRWFFDSWVYRDMGLPDLSIANVFVTSASEPGQYLTTVDVANEGYAEVEAPIAVRSRDAFITDWVRVPARGKVTHRIVVRGGPVEVQLNDGSIPEVVATIHRTAIAAARAE